MGYAQDGGAWEMASEEMDKVESAVLQARSFEQVQEIYSQTAPAERHKVVWGWELYLKFWRHDPSVETEVAAWLLGEIRTIVTRMASQEGDIELLYNAIKQICECWLSKHYGLGEKGLMLDALALLCTYRETGGPLPLIVRYSMPMDSAALDTEIARSHSFAILVSSFVSFGESASTELSEKAVELLIRFKAWRELEGLAKAQTSFPPHLISKTRESLIAMLVEPQNRANHRLHLLITELGNLLLVPEQPVPA